MIFVPFQICCSISISIDKRFFHPYVLCDNPEKDLDSRRIKMGKWDWKNKNKLLLFGVCLCAWERWRKPGRWKTIFIFTKFFQSLSSLCFPCSKNVQSLFLFLFFAILLFVEPWNRLGFVAKKKKGLRIKQLESTKMWTQTGPIFWVCNLYGLDLTVYV